MNLQNIAALSAMLSRAGFASEIGYKILQRICFKPAAFTLTERVQKNNDGLTCSLHFERSGDDYSCPYYDISLIKGFSMPERSINGIDLQELDLSMKNIDWQFRESNPEFRLGDEQTWKREKLIAATINDLSRMSATEEGKYFADALRVKYWTGAGLEELVGNLSAIRSRFEITQRVYFIDGDSISLDEAYRFLLNRWMEKKMQAKKRMQEKDEQNSFEVTSGEGQSKGLLIKKRRKRIKRMKQ